MTPIHLCATAFLLAVSASLASPAGADEVVKTTGGRKLLLHFDGILRIPVAA